MGRRPVAFAAVQGARKPHDFKADIQGLEISHKSLLEAWHMQATGTSHADSGGSPTLQQLRILILRSVQLMFVLVK